mgnify:CR=1 FL=1
MTFITDVNPSTTVFMSSLLKRFWATDVPVSEETYKSTYKILEEISGIWNDLTDKNQAQLLEVLAGKRNGQALAALISNFSCHLF